MYKMVNTKLMYIKNIYSLAIFWNLVAITNSRFAQLFWPVFLLSDVFFSGAVEPSLGLCYQTVAT